MLAIVVKLDGNVGAIVFAHDGDVLKQRIKAGSQLAYLRRRRGARSSGTLT